jgi:23S rRNA (uracil1939-C5)-methyltransferase
VVDVQTFQETQSVLKKTVHFHEFSEHRVNQYEHFGVCGGCKWQNMNYNQQLFYKQNEVNHLQHWKNKLPEFESILGSEKSFLQK